MSLSLAATTRTILITGATDGIGRHTAKKLAADGNTILLVHGRRPTVGADLITELKEKGAQDALYFNADLGNLQEVERLASEISQSVDKIDVLINNAGAFDPPPDSSSHYDKTWAVNVMAPFLLTRRLLPLMLNSQDECPRIITTSSVSQSSTLVIEDLFSQSKKKKNAHRAYSDSKLGDLMFTIQLANILKHTKIKCLTMDPGTVNTKMLLAGWGPCGIDIENANNTYKLATEYGKTQTSGSYHFGGSTSRQSKDTLHKLWQALEQHTGCTYDDILSNP